MSLIQENQPVYAASTVAAAAEKLCELSRQEYVNPYASPYAPTDWPQSLDTNQWSMSRDLISIAGLESFGKLSETEQKRLSFFEAVNFFSLNIHGEKALVEGLARRLYRKDMACVSSYLHHFLDEENKHMLYFGEFCKRYAGKVYPDRKLALERQFEDGEENFLFFAKVMIFEEIVDAYNMRMSIDSSLQDLPRQINLWHHKDEARHLAFGRKLVAALFQRYCPSWSAETLAAIRQYLVDYIRATWKEYYNPLVYRDAGLENPYELQEEALKHPLSVGHRRYISRRLVRFLLASGILNEEPNI
ncbi:MAG TPA: diiron oxygenase [Chroococcales cyanobacterium]